MKHYLAHFIYTGSGVGFEIKMSHESKHYHLETLDFACEKLADKLGASFLYYEEITP